MMWKNLKNDVLETMLSLETIKMTLDYDLDIKPRLKNKQFTSVYTRNYITIVYFENGLVMRLKNFPIAVAYLIDGKERQNYVIEPFWDFSNNAIQGVTEFFNLDNEEQLRRYIRDGRIKKANISIF